MIVKEKQGNLLDADEHYIMHQCNCCTLKSHGLSAQIANKWPECDLYAKRPKKTKNATSKPDTPGQCILLPTKDGKKGVICALAQWAPGKPGQWEEKYIHFMGCRPNKPDTKPQRVEWFKECICHLERWWIANGNPLIGVPANIGCGFAGGDWTVYKDILEESSIHFVVYSL